MMRRKPEMGDGFYGLLGNWMRLDVSGTIYRQMDNWTWEKCLND